VSPQSPCARVGGEALAAVLALAGCEVPAEPAEPDPEWEVDGDAVPSGWRAPTGPCDLDPPSPSRLVLTTTDFVTGAITVVDAIEGTVEADVAVGSTDAVPFAHGGQMIVVHRYQLDRIDVLDPESWSLVAQHALPSEGPSANPQAVAFDASGRAWVTTFAEPTLRGLDLQRPPAAAQQARIELSGFADDDGNPEASLAVTCGDLVLVTAQRLDPAFVPHGPDVLIAVDPARAEALDLEPRTTEPDALPLLGGWVRQLRRDPADPEGRTLLALSTGIERIELRSGRRHWAVAPDVMAQAHIDGRLQPQAFDVDDAGTLAYLAAYDADFSQVRLYRVGLDGAAPAVPEAFADGLDSVEHTLELVGSNLWYGSTRAQAPGLWRFDVRGDVPQRVAGPLPTGLPPYSMVAIP
jgi:hypothetical protein